MKPSSPPRVPDHYTYWTNPPEEPSPRCLYWVARFKEGWRPNARISSLGYDGRAEFYGVYIWEELHILYGLPERLAGNPIFGRPLEEKQLQAYGLKEENT